MEVFLNIVLFFLCALFFLVFSVALIILFAPVTLFVDTVRGLYMVSFPGGRFNYRELEGVRGIEYVFLWKKGFKPLYEILAGKGKKEEKEETNKDKSMELKEETGEEGGKESLTGVLWEERRLVKLVLKKLYRFLVDLFKVIQVEKMYGTFYVPDPYYLGLCYAALGPLTRKNFRVTPNFENRNFLIARLFILPGSIVWRLLKLLVSLPLVRIYRLFRRIG